MTLISIRELKQGGEVTWKSKSKLPLRAGSPEVKKHLEDMGFVAGGLVTVVSSLNGNVIVKVKEARVAISEEMARKIMV